MTHSLQIVKIKIQWQEKIFDSEQIQPKGFIEYVADNLGPGNYTFFTATDRDVTEQIAILPK